MDIYQALQERHSVRQFLPIPLKEVHREALDFAIKRLNNMSGGLDMRLILNEPLAFGKSLWAHYGHFENAVNYVVLAGKKNDPYLEERLGYYGEYLVLYAQELGINSCFVGGSYKKNCIPLELPKDEKIVAVIAIGYGQNQGKPHKSKSFEDVTEIYDDKIPNWFRQGVEAALLAPTALNQQRFKFILKEGQASAKALTGVLTKLDLGIVEYNFKVASHTCTLSDEKIFGSKKA